MITPGQSRAARAFLNWSQRELAAKCDVGLTAIVGFEAGTSSPRRASLAALVRTFEEAGIEFIPAAGGAGPGVRLRAP